MTGSTVARRSDARKRMDEIQEQRVGGGGGHSTRSFESEAKYHESRHSPKVKRRLTLDVNRVEE